MSGRSIDLQYGAAEVKAHAVFQILNMGKVQSAVQLLHRLVSIGSIDLAAVFNKFSSLCNMVGMTVCNEQIDRKTAGERVT